MYSLKWVRTMENSMEARVSAVITTLKHVLFEFHSEGGPSLIKVGSTKASVLPLVATFSHLCPTKVKRENNAAVS